MSITLATGTQYAIASAYGTSYNMTAITNATEAVATLAAGHGTAVGDILEITSGWGLLNNRVVRVKTVSTNDVTLESINTTDTAKYPAGSGTGSVRKITTWQQISQLRAPSASGGEQQYADTSTLDDVDDKQMPSSRSALSIALEVLDDPSLAWYATVESAQDAGTPKAVRISTPNGAKIYGNAFWTMAQMPTVERNQPLRLTVNFTLAARRVRYAS